MPYIIKKVQEGFKVCKRDEPSKCFSKKPLTKSTAKRQLQAIGISEGKGKISNKFMNQLTKLDIDPEKYLFIARENAKMKGYNPELLEYADDNIHKLKYVDVPFGRVGYNDFIIYLFTTDEQTALNKRKNYRKRAYKVMEETNDKQSPATLAYEILW